MENSSLKMIRAFLLAEIVTCQVLGRKPYDKWFGQEDPLPKRRISGGTSNIEAVQLFGLYGDNWDGKENEMISKEEIEKWKKFLVVSDAEYDTYFAFPAGLRKIYWEEIQQEHIMGTFRGESFNGYDHFKGDPHGERLLLLRRFSKIIVDDMFLNYADGRELQLLGSPERSRFYHSWGTDGLIFSGKPNQYISQAEIDAERDFLGISTDEFNRFYALDYGERYLLLKSRWYN